MIRMPGFVRVLALVAACAGGWPGATFAQGFGASDFGYGNGGFMGSRGTAIAACATRSTASWSSCGRVCGPSWRGGCRVPCGPCGPGGPGGGGYWFGFPGLGFGGCYGASRFSSFESVSVVVPNGGGASFFSGSAVPFVTGVVPVVGGWPMNWLPGYAVGPWGWYPAIVPAPVGVGPVFGPAAIAPFLGADATSRRAGLAAGPAAVPALVVAAKPVSESVRRRAARFVATGDRHLREAEGDPARLRAALAAYRSAAAAAADDPDVFVRQSLVAVALGDESAATQADRRAIALDGRLAPSRPRPAAVAADPVFGGSPADAPPALAARGLAILHAIGSPDDAGFAADGPLAALAVRWSGRWADATHVALHR